MKLKLTVTKKDMVPISGLICETCPVALAFKKCFKDQTIIKVFMKYIRIGSLRYKTPAWLMDKINDFDNGKLKPFSEIVNLIKIKV